MPIGFPASPTTGQQWPTASPIWEYDGAKWVAISGVAGAATPVTDRLTSIVGTDDFIGLRAGAPYLVAASVIADYTGGAPADTAPAAFTAGQWTAAATSTAGEISFNLTALPADGGSPITALEYRVGTGSAIAFAGTGTGVRVVTAGLTAGVAVDLQVRAVNAVGAGAWSDIKNRTPAASGGGGSLTVVQAPALSDQEFNTAVEVALSAVGSGNAVLFGVQASTSAGAPTITDSAGGSWGSPIYTVVGASDTTYFYARSGITSGLTWVRATYGSGAPMRCGAVEVSGAGAGLALDASGGTTQSASTSWDTAFTASSASTLFMEFGQLSNFSTATGVAPLAAYSPAASYFVLVSGVFTGSGAKTGSFTLADTRSGEKAWVAVKAS